MLSAPLFLFFRVCDDDQSALVLWNFPVGLAVGMGGHRRDEGLTMNGFFAYIWWPILGLSYCMGVFYFSVGMMFEDNQEWWFPFVLPLVVPLFWIHKNRFGLVALLAVLLLLIAVSMLYAKVFS